MEKDDYVDIKQCMTLDNILNKQFSSKQFGIGITEVSKYAGMIVGLLNIGLAEENVVEIIKAIIEKE